MICSVCVFVCLRARTYQACDERGGNFERIFFSLLHASIMLNVTGYLVMNLCYTTHTRTQTHFSLMP